MKLETKIRKKIDEEYKPRRAIKERAKFLLELSSIKHQHVKNHSMWISLLAEAVAIAHGMSKLIRQAVFYVGLFHDIGKITLPPELFDGHNFEEPEEYEQVKEHSLNGSIALENTDRFIAYCVGRIHPGYGLTKRHIPKKWDNATKKRTEHVIAIVRTCDYIDASQRDTVLLDGTDKNAQDLKAQLANCLPKEEFPLVDTEKLIETALDVHSKLSKENIYINVQNK